MLDRPGLKIEVAYWKFIDSDAEESGPFAKADELLDDYVGDYGMGPFAYKQIEWVEIPRKVVPFGYEKVPYKHWEQDVDAAVAILREADQFEIEMTPRGLRIYGFK